ncbi:MAG: methyltransferase [Gemmatimonadota bacterium]
MTASQPLVGDEVLQACDFRDRAHLLDIGGGEGGFLLATAERYAHLELTLFDLPPVARRARRLLDASDRPEARRIRTVGGDFFTDSLPGGADVITLLRVLLDHDDPRALRILRAAHQALAPGGTLVVAEATVDGHGAERVGATYFNLYLLALGSGRARSRAELTALLRQAGFRRVRSPGTRLPIQTSVLTAIR